MTFPEYLYRMKAHSLSRVDKEYDLHLQAWLNEQVGATKKQGKNSVPLYKNFKDFFDYNKAIETIKGAESSSLSDEHKRMARIAANLNK